MKHIASCIPDAACALQALTLASSVFFGAIAPHAAASDVPPPAAVCAGYEELLFCGDLNGDCNVSVTDALRVLRIAVGQLAFEIEADMNGNGEVTTADALIVLRMSVGSQVQTYGCDPDHVVLTAVSSGFYSQSGAHTAGNYAVGWYATSVPPMVELRDYFVFDLSAVAKTITAARLHVTTAPTSSIIYGSQDPSETYAMFGVTTPVATLTSGSAGTAGFADLADGQNYGSFVATPALGAFADVPFSPAGITALNAASGQLAIGGAITTLAKAATNEFLFNATKASFTRQLVLTVE